MLFVIVGDNKKIRKEKLGEVLQPFSESEIILYDDTAGNLEDMEQYLYPSLFSLSAPIVHAQFMLSSDISTDFYKKLSASPTVFIFEEITLPTTLVTTLKKSGAIAHVTEKSKDKKEQSDIFAATLCITAKDKKSRWLAFRSAMEKHPVEAILGILYWKVRSMASKEKSGGQYEKLYHELLDAQSRAWRSGAPLEALIEKVILTQ